MLLCETVLPSAKDFVDLEKIDFGIRVRVKEAPRCLLRRPVAEALAKIQSGLSLQNRKLVVWACYRPTSVLATGDRAALANGLDESVHARGVAVDVGLLEAESAKAVEMPTGYQERWKAAKRPYHGSTRAQRKNAEHLRAVMESGGFRPQPLAWWHFDFIEKTPSASENFAYDEVK